MFCGDKSQRWTVRMMRVVMADTHVLKPQMGQAVQQIGSIEPVAVLFVAAAESRDIQARLVFLTIEGMLKARLYERHPRCKFVLQTRVRFDGRIEVVCPKVYPV